MDEIVKGVIETTSLPENVEQLVKIGIKEGKATATLYANPNGSKIKQRLDNLEARFNSLKTINYEELYGPGNISITQGGGASGDVTKSYVNSQDSATLEKAKSYADTKVSDLRTYVDNASSTTLAQAKAYADTLAYGGGSGDADKSTVVLIDAVGRASAARSEAYTAYKGGKAIVLKCAADKYIPMTVTAEVSDGVNLKGFDLSYSGYTVSPNVTLVTRMWTLDSTGLNYIEKQVPINSCRTFDCTNTSTVTNMFYDAMDASKNGLSVILKVDANTYVIANTVTSTSLTGYTFSFNSGTLSDGSSGIVSVDIIRWRLTSSGLKKDTFNTSSSGGSGSGSGGGVTITQAFSTKTTTQAIPDNPDDDPTFWNQTAQTSASIWAAQKSTGNDWVIWKLQPQDGKNGTDGNGIKNITKVYARSSSGETPPSYPGTDWKETMPSASNGEYIWCRVSITYTLSTDETVYYTVSYIAKNGQDGADGTSVNIIDTLDSKEDLPTSGNNNGDGYLINGELWVYNGNAITSDVTYRGFTNVGNIQGPAGKVPCMHIAWCNGDPANGDYTGFDVDAPDGSLFDYIGIYVDYKDSIDTVCPDPSDPSLYSWKRIRGADATSPVIMDLSNESVEIPLTYDGKVEYSHSVYTRIAVYEGAESLDITNIDVETSLNISVSKQIDLDNGTDYKAQVTFSLDKDYGGIGSGSNEIKIRVTAKCSDGSSTHVSEKSFYLVGVKAGEPGKPAVTYDIFVSPQDSVTVVNGVYSTEYISSNVLVTEGEGNQSYLSDRTDIQYELKYSKDGGSEVSTILNYNVDITDVRRYIRFIIYINGVARDYETVPVNKLNDGSDGEPAKIVETTYEYAVSMSFTKTPEDLTAWSSTAVDVEPGQYLYIKTIRLWNNGETTYDYSWTRGGLNGYSNLPYVSTAFYRLATQPSTPVGGTYYDSLKDSPEWSDGIPDGTAKLWFSQRRFTIDGLPPQDTEWSEPVSALSTSDIAIRYSSEDECPKDPDTAASSVWSAIPDMSSKWMAVRKTINGIDQNWVMYLITGENPVLDNVSAATPYMGEWQSDGLYCGNRLRTDIVKVTGSSTGTSGTYYYMANKTKDFGLDENGECVGTVTPQPGTTEGDKYWLRFGANFDNIATGIIFSEKVITDTIEAINAHIDELDVNKLDADIVDIVNAHITELDTDNITAKKVLVGTEGGQRVEILPDSKSVDICNSSGELVSTLEGNEYSDINSLFGNGTVTLAVTNPSWTKNLNESESNVIALTSAKQVDNAFKLVINSGTITAVNGESRISYGDIPLNVYLAASVYKESSCTNLIVRKFIDGGRADFNSNLSINLTGTSCKVLQTGWLRIEIIYSFYKTSNPTYTQSSVSWSSISGITCIYDFYVARYFANGFVLGSGKDNYISSHRNSAGEMVFNTRNEGISTHLSNANGLLVRKSTDAGTSYWREIIGKNTIGLPLNVLAIGEIYTSGTTAYTVGVKTCDNNTVSAKRTSTGTYTVTIPSAWGSGYLVFLTTLGRTNEGNPTMASVASQSSGTFIVDVKTSQGNWYDGVKIRFLIVSPGDFGNSLISWSL